MSTHQVLAPGAHGRIETYVSSGVPSNKWLSVATQKARAIAAERGIRWADADVYVALPEPGRCFTKCPGKTALSAHG